MLLVVDPAARRVDGEAVRIARDVLCAGAPGAKVCLPECGEEAARALARRGSRRPVLIGDDRVLLNAVRLLDRERELADAALAVVPVGADARVALARGLGVPSDVVSAARAVLSGVERPLDLLADETGGLVLGGLRIPGGEERRGVLGRAGPRLGLGALARGAPENGDGARRPAGPGEQRRGAGVLGGWGGFGRRGPGEGGPDERTGAGPPGEERVPAPRQGGVSGGRSGPRGLRVEADGRVLAGPGGPVTEISVAPRPEGGRGMAEVAVRPARGGAPVRARARAVTVSGPEFRYHADTWLAGPVTARTWTVRPDAWRLVLPGG
ncbi:hypothetical protein [Streptomyces sp. AJS327]|uniref:hypothetical protein n=1 Tax=Streptomyces sp. AJS327 TaxID=2545265 RepID=UPI0027E4F3D6|nr:hypothetical protein [Streptomyces sp. AJS327]